MSNQREDDCWSGRIDSLDIDAVVENDRAFKSMLGIGEDAYASSRWLNFLGGALGTVGAVGTGAAVATSPVVAGAFFPAGGVLALMGLGTAVTPVGWVLVGAAASGLGYVGLRKIAGRMAGPVEVIPRFINSPMDLLAASLFEVMAPLALKVAKADGELQDVERQKMREYFAGSWGYNGDFVDLELDCMEGNLPDLETGKVVGAFAELCEGNSDCNLPAITLDIESFLQDLAAADGKIGEEERRELDRIRRAFRRHERKAGVIWIRRRLPFRRSGK